jgi:hypothetical protein
MEESQLPEEMEVGLESDLYQPKGIFVDLNDITYIADGNNHPEFEMTSNTQQSGITVRYRNFWK